MVHLVFLHAEQELEAGLAGGRAVGHGHALAQEIVGNAFQPLGEGLAAAPEQLDDLRFAPRRLLFGGQAADKPWEVEARERGPALNPVDLHLQPRYQADVNQHLRDGPGLRRGAEAIMLLADFFGDGQGIAADCPEAASEILCAVIGHAL